MTSTADTLDFGHEAFQALDEAARRFGLTEMALPRDEVALVGNGFAIVVAPDFDDVSVTYVEYDPRRMRAYSYRIGTWVDQRFTPEDRALYGRPMDRAEYVRAALRVVASGLTNRCADLLSEDRSWLRWLRDRDPQAWSPTDARPYLAPLALSDGFTTAGAGSSR